MHFHYQHMEALGYKILGHSNRSRNVCSTFTKKFPVNNSIVCFSVRNSNKIYVFFLSDADYKQYNDGKTTLTPDASEIGRICGGGGEVYCYNKCFIIFNGGDIKNQATLKVYLDKAEQLASTRMLIRKKLVCI